LYLRALLDELRVFGIHEKLDDRIEHYLAAATIPGLYEKVLERYEADYERDRVALAQDAMTLLWAARRGLSEAELLDMLGTDQGPLPRAHWSPLYLAAESSLVSRSGLIGFAHDYIRQAVQDKYLPTEREQRSVHLQLVEYFEPRDLDSRKVDELPWQLAQTKSWQRLATLLADLPFFEAAWDADQYQVKTYWAQVEANSPLRMLIEYQPVLDAPERHTDYVWNIATLLEDSGHKKEALSLRQYLVEHYRRTSSREMLQKALGNQARVLYEIGEPDVALALDKEQERICRELGDMEGLSNCLNSQGLMLEHRGDLDGAMALYQESERICRVLGHKRGLAVTLLNQGNLLRIREPDGAIALYRESEQISRELGDTAGMLGSLANQGGILLEHRGDLDGAIALFRKSERFSRQLGLKPQLALDLGHLASILESRFDMVGALAGYKEQERICREVGMQDVLASSLLIQANLLSGPLGKHMEAMPLAEEALEIYTRLQSRFESVARKSLDDIKKRSQRNDLRDFGWVLRSILLLLGVGSLGLHGPWLWLRIVGWVLCFVVLLHFMLNVMVYWPGFLLRLGAYVMQQLPRRIRAGIIRFLYR